MDEIDREWEPYTCDDACQAAVLRVFTELRRLGECEEMALTAALKVFAFHAPRTPPHLASAIVAGWARRARAGAPAPH
jgi:hypothetical protein